VVSAVTVAGSLASLLVFPQAFLYSMGVAGMMVAAVAALASVVVLPGVLALLGDRLAALAPARWQRAADRDARPATSGGWYRLSRFVMRRPGSIAAVTSIALIALGLPFLGLRITEVDQSVVPESSGARQVQERLDAQFPPNRVSPVYLVSDAPPTAAARARLEELRAGLGSLSSVGSVSKPKVAGGGAWRVDVFGRGHRFSEDNQRLVDEIRDLRKPYPTLVGGETASLVDLKAGLENRLPLALAIVVFVTVTVLFLMTGSVVLPLKAVVMNALTLCATFGVMVLIFQDGRFEDLLGYTSAGALEPSQMILLFAVAFGLSTDYGVFLLGRIKEERTSGRSEAEAVATGLERTGRIITAAALLLCVALGALVVAQHASVKEVGFGAALAIAIDASIVRAFLVPSLMCLLGRRNWWAPRPLRWLHNRLRLSETG
jgi:RND superfamily putative drug exporter